MANKKQSVLEAEMADKDMMEILSMNGTSEVFKQNDLIDFSYPTGISVIDYSLGYEVNIKDDSGKLIAKRTCLGLQAGSFNVISGPTQSFKTTFGMKMCADIAYKFGGNVVHLDAENRLVVQRLKNMTKLPDSWFDGEHPRYALRCGAIGYDTLQNYVTEIYESKMKFKNLLVQDTGVVDEHNKPIMLMPPTIIFLDSLSDVIGKEYDMQFSKEWEKQKEMRSNTDGMRNAKTLKGVICDILPMLKEANIIFITIAHESANVSATIAPPKKQFQYGDAGTKMAGGRAVEYNASAVMIFNAEVSADSRYEEATDGFTGNTVLYEPYKISTNQSGNKRSGRGFRIVVDKTKNGCDNLRTLVLFLNERGRLKGNKAGFKVLNKDGSEACESRFTWKKIYEDFKENQELYKAFLMASKEELDTLIAPALDVAGQIKPFSIMDELNALS